MPDRLFGFHSTNTDSVKGFRPCTIAEISPVTDLRSAYVNRHSWEIQVLTSPHPGDALRALMTRLQLPPSPVPNTLPCQPRAI